MARALLFALLITACSPAALKSQIVAETAVTAPSPVGFLGEVTGDSVAPLIAALKTHPTEFTLIIASPGGSVYAGLDLIDAITEAQWRGTHVTCIVPNKAMAASMAAAILETCDLRVMGPQSSILFHTASVSGAAGNQWALLRLVREMDSINHRLAILISGRLSLPIAEYERRVADRDYWLGYEEALEIGAIDGVI